MPTHQPPGYPDEYLNVRSIIGELFFHWFGEDSRMCLTFDVDVSHQNSKLLRCLMSLICLHEVRENVDGQGKNNRWILFGRNCVQSLKKLWKQQCGRRDVIDCTPTTVLLVLSTRAFLGTRLRTTPAGVSLVMKEPSSAVGWGSFNLRVSHISPVDISAEELPENLRLLQRLPSTPSRLSALLRLLSLWHVLPLRLLLRPPSLFATV